MRTALADRLSRALVGCYPPRWKQRYAAELLDVLDQHRAGPRTVLSLAGGVLSTHLDPSYRVEIRVMPHLGRDTWLYIAIFAVIMVGRPRTRDRSRNPQRHQGKQLAAVSGGSVGTVAFSRDLRLMVSTTGGPPWDATSTLWDITDRARPRRLSLFEGGNPITISPDGRTVATSAFGGRPAPVERDPPAPPGPAGGAAAGFSGALWGEAFSPDGRVLAVASTSGLVLWNVADPARPRLLRTLAAAPLQPVDPGPVPFGVGKGDLVFSPDGHLLASVSGSGQATVWNVTPRPMPPASPRCRPRDYFTALAFSPRGNLLAGVTYHGSVLMFRVAGPAPPARVTTRPGILASARFPGGGNAPVGPCGPGPDCGVPAAYAAGFTPDGRALTVVIDRPET